MRRRSLLLLLPTLTLALDAVADGPPPAAVSVRVPSDGRQLVAHAIYPGGGTRPPIAGEVAQLQQAFVPTIVVQNAQGLPATALGPFHCEASDACHFSQMPAYNQANPNFAFIEVPHATLAAEKNALGPVVHRDGAAGVLMSNGSFDTYYASWLPYGPLPGDLGSGNYWYTDICVPTSSSMALMAAILHKSATTSIRPASFTADFLAGHKPASQLGPGRPLEHDHSTLGPQMTAEDLQRVVNTAVHENDDPTAGGSVTAFAALATDDFYYSGPGPTHAVAQTEHHRSRTAGGSEILTGEMIAHTTRAGYVTVISVGDYVVSITTQPPIDPHGVARSAMTFTRDAGHAIAVNGYRVGTDGKIVLRLFNPVYAQAEDKELTVVDAGVVPGGCGGAPGICTVTLPDGASAGTLMAKGTTTSVSGLGDLRNGQHIYFLQLYDSLRVE